MIKRLFFCGFIIFVLSAPLSFYAHEVSAKTTNKASKPAAPINVKTAKAENLTIPQTISAVGHIRAINSVDLSFEISGQITKIYKHAGRIKKGDVLARLNDAQDQAQLTADQATEQLAKSTMDRYQKLGSSGDVSQQLLEQKKAAYATAKAAVVKDQATIQQKVLKAPFDGVLGTTDYSVGSYLAQGTTLFTLVQLAPLKARYSIPASEKKLVEVGQSIVVTSASNEDKTFKGIVKFISPNVNAQSGTITIDATVQNPDYLLSPGMFVSVEQTVDANRKLLMIPDIALMTDVQGRYVFLVNGNTVEKQAVTVGLISHGLAQIKKGLKVGDEIVTAGQQRLDDGSTIKIIGHSKTAPKTKTPPKKASSPSTKSS